MIRVALRQFRTEAVVGFGLLAAFAIALAVTGPHLAHVYDAFETSCKAAGNCATARNPVLSVDKPLQSALPFILIIAPAVVGVFFGAPLIAQELETGTFRLAWTQSVTRRRWLAVKLGVVGVAAMAISGLLTWMGDWWTKPLDAVRLDRFGAANFASHGIVPIGYAAFAFALGATAGVLLRRTVPAMGATLAGFAAARFAVTYSVRPNLIPPVRESLPLTAGSGPGFDISKAGAVSITPPTVHIPNGWVYSTTVVNKTGVAPTSQLVHACPTLRQPSGLDGGGDSTAHSLSSIVHLGTVAPAPGHFPACVTKLSATLHTVVTYQPANRYWPFQWAEMGIFLAAALALCGLTYLWLRRQYA